LKITNFFENRNTEIPSKKKINLSLNRTRILINACFRFPEIIIIKIGKHFHNIFHYYQDKDNQHLRANTRKFYRSSKKKSQNKIFKINHQIIKIDLKTKRKNGSLNKKS